MRMAWIALAMTAACASWPQPQEIERSSASSAAPTDQQNRDSHGSPSTVDTHPANELQIRAKSGNEDTAKTENHWWDRPSITDWVIAFRGGPTNLDRFRGRDKWNSAGYAAAASG